MQIDDDVAELDPQTLEEAQEASIRAQEIVNDGIAELRALKPPSDIADDVETGTDKLAETAGVLGEMADLTDQADFVEKTTEIDDLQAEAQETLGPLGIECDGSDGSSSDDSNSSDDSSDSSDDSGGDSDDSSGSSGGDDSSSGGSSGSVPDPDPASSISDYGNDPVLDELADECEAGEFDSCDELYLRTEIGSSYEAYGQSCGGRNEPLGFCTGIYG